MTHRVGSRATKPPRGARGSSALYLTGVLPWWATVPHNAIASGVLFTVAYDAAHHSLSSNTRSLLSPLLLFQNYHLVHHLHPIVPFHKYIAVWRRNEEQYLAGDPALSTVRGRPLTVDEYRALRAHDHH